MMSRKFLFKTLTLLIFITYWGGLAAQDDCATVGNSVGLNYQFYNDGAPSKIEGIARRWRQFTAWHNMGYYPKDCNPDVYSSDPGEVNNFSPTWKYIPDENYIDTDRPININIQNLIAEGKADLAYPAMTLSHPFLSTNRYYDTGDEIWEDLDEDDVNSPLAGWRKPVPFIKQGGTLINTSDFDDPYSYRFYSDFLSYYLGVFGSQDIDPLLIKNQSAFSGMGWTKHFEIWNEPTAHWTDPNDYGYFKPKELAAMTASILGGATLDQCAKEVDDNCQTISNSCIEDVNVGLVADPNLTLISPAPHEMDVNYFADYMKELRTFVGQGFNFEINAFHHYSAYRRSDLVPGISVDNIVDRSVLKNDKPIAFHLNPTESLMTMNLESAPFTNEATWICPELDGYKRRGEVVKGALAANDITGDVWITEWGYSTRNSGNAANFLLIIKARNPKHKLDG